MFRVPSRISSQFSVGRPVFKSYNRRFFSSSSSRLSSASKSHSGVFGAVAGALLLGSQLAWCDDNSNDDELPTRDISACKYEHPTRPGLSIVVADNIEEVVYDPNTDVLVDVYHPDCVFCERLSPVLDQVAYALAPVSTFRLAIMDGSRNYKQGFLTKEELAGSPTIKFYPATPEPNGTEVRLQNAKALIEYIHTNSTHKFDLDAALKRAEEIQDKIQAKISRVFRRQVKQRLAGFDSYGVLHYSSPCGKTLTQLEELFTLGKYTGDQKVMDRITPVWKEYQTCINSKKYTDYWSQAAEVCVKELDAIERAESKKAAAN